MLDEPSSGLDPIVRRDILAAIIRTIADEGRTVLFSSHLLDEVERVSDRVAMMRAGRIVFCDALDQIKQSHAPGDAAVRRRAGRRRRHWPARWRGRGGPGVDGGVRRPGRRGSVGRRGLGRQVVERSLLDARRDLPRTHRRARAGVGGAVMRSAAIGLAYPLWLRLRWARPRRWDICCCGRRRPPAATRRPRRPGRLTAPDQPRPSPPPAQTPLPAILTAAPLLFAMASLLAASTYGSADLTSKNLGFPTHMLVLPLPTRALVGWPMLFGAGGVALAWLLLARLVLIPAGVTVPLLWTAVMVCAVTAWVQAIDWWPFAVPAGRAVCTTLALLAIAGFAAWATNRGVPPLVVAGCYGAATVVAYLVARAGVSLARHGQEHDGLFPMRLPFIRPPLAGPAHRFDRVKAFRSPSAAQFWLERRRNALLFPALCAASFAPMLLPLAASPARHRAPLLIFGVELSPLLMIVIASAIVPVIMAAAVSAAMGKSDVFRKDIRFAPFLATRPLSTGGFVVAKFKSAAFGTFLAWLAVLALLLVGSALGALRSTGPTRIFEPLRQHYSPHNVALWLGAFLLLLLLTWRNQVQGLFIVLSGRPWINKLLSGLFAVGWMIALFAGGFLYSHPAARSTLRAAAPKLLVGAIAIKAVAAATVCLLLLRTRLMSPRTLTMCFLLWATTGAACGLILSRFVTVTPTLTGWLILLLPATRIALAAAGAARQPAPVDDGTLCFRRIVQPPSAAARRYRRSAWQWGLIWEGRSARRCCTPPPALPPRRPGRSGTAPARRRNGSRRNRAATSLPSVSGIITSSRTTSGPNSRAASSANAGSFSSRTSKYPFASRLRFIQWEKSGFVVDDQDSRFHFQGSLLPAADRPCGAAQ